MFIKRIRDTKRYPALALRSPRHEEGRPDGGAGWELFKGTASPSLYCKKELDLSSAAVPLSNIYESSPRILYTDGRTPPWLT